MLNLLIPNGFAHYRQAAETFLSLYRAVCGKTPRIVTDDDSRSDLVVFGTDTDNLFLHNLLMEKKIPDFSIRRGTDEYQILSHCDGLRTILFLFPGNIRATFYAVYDFFEQAADCRYFWDGDIIPKKNTVRIDGFDLVRKPRFEYRGLRYFAHRSLHRFQAEHWDFDDWKNEFDWILKKRLNLAMLRIGLDDLFQKTFPDIVPYPRLDEPLPEAIDRSYDDRTPFWPLEYRGELRKKILAYGRSRGLLQPEDCGAMTHWYSRTPKAYLEAVKPAFAPQSGGCYRQETGLVWDVRSDENLEQYFKLSDTYTKEYGDGALFHTIGLAERRCFSDRDRNHQMKLYAYRRIITKLRERHPQSPLLLASWDFISTWTHEEVKSLIAELNPANTVLLDYTSDIYDDQNNFRNWGVVGKFPWIFGIFHAFEPSNEIRGMYDKIADRFPVAVEDPMCKGVVFWPENSHQDTLMLDFFPSIAWDPSVYKIEDFIDGFCDRRYSPRTAKKMKSVWHDALPLIKACLWGASPLHGNPQREIFPDLYFLIGRGGWILGEIDAKRYEFFTFKCEELLPHMEDASKILKRLSALCREPLDPFTKRDVLDLARTIFSRLMNYAIAKTGLMIESWRNDAGQYLYADKKFTAKEIREHFKTMRAFAKTLTDLLEASEDFSLFLSLQELRKRHTTHPDFEHTLKGNAEDKYCRSFIFELAKFCYEPALAQYESFALKRLQENDKRSWTGLTPQFDRDNQPVIDAFYAKPLAEMAPDIPGATARLPDTLGTMAHLALRLK